MNQLSSEVADAPSACPMKPSQLAMLKQDDVLGFAFPKRVQGSYAADESGQQVYRICYGNKEVVFDEPKYFSFGEALVQRTKFVARDATHWGGERPWSAVQEVLAALVGDGVLVFDTQSANSAANDEPEIIPAKGEETRPRTWLECETLSEELTGVPLPLQYLELVVPVYRIVHPALDTDARQVGENNVFPSALRLRVDTDWRTCHYAGSRNRDACPMNVTALRAMTQHWKSVLALLAIVRCEYVRRVPRAASGFSLVDVEVFSNLVLGFPTYLMLKRRNPIPNGKLHPALSSLFRVTDGLRLLAQAITTAPAETPLAPEACLSPREVYEYAERNLEFMSTNGVCAGPPQLIAEFLDLTLLGQEREPSVTDGRKPSATEGLDPWAAPLLEALPRAVDYTLHALRAFVVAADLSGETAATYERLSQALEQRLSGAETPLGLLAQLCRQRASYLAQTQLGSADGRDFFRRRYGALFAAAGEALAAVDGPDYDSIVGGELKADGKLILALAKRLRGTDSAFASDVNEAQRVAKIVHDYALQQQALLRAADRLQRSVNVALVREPSVVELTNEHLAVHNRLSGEDPGFPRLEDDLFEASGVKLLISASRIDVN